MHTSNSDDRNISETSAEPVQGPRGRLRLRKPLFLSNTGSLNNTIPGVA